MLTADEFAGLFRKIKKSVKNSSAPVIDLIAASEGSPYTILTATILSARTKDEVTARAAERLFRIAPTLRALSKLSSSEIEQLIYPVGFYRVKSRALKKLPEVIDKLYNGKIPDTIDGLLTLPGVGRKTANLTVSRAFKKPGICVDIHVHRIMNRIGYVRTRNPFETETALRAKLPRRYWSDVNTVFVMFGQKICRPVSPHCVTCPAAGLCGKHGLDSLS